MSPSTTSKVNNARGSFSQPHFEERSVTIRRLSSIPGQPSDVIRLNSVSSSLNSLDLANKGSVSDVLPYGGGRRSLSSTGGIEVTLLEDLPLHHLDVPREGMVPVRMVSVQKGDGHARLRSVSGSTYGSPTDPRFKNVTLPNEAEPVVVEQLEPIVTNLDPTHSMPTRGNEDNEINEKAHENSQIDPETHDLEQIENEDNNIKVKAPPLGDTSNHSRTRSPTLPELPRHTSLSEQILTALAPAKSPRKANKRPDSILLLQSKSPTLSSAKRPSTAPVSSKTMTTPDRQSTTPDTAGSVFASWKGFPPRQSPTVKLEEVMVVEREKEGERIGAGELEAPLDGVEVDVGRKEVVIRDQRTASWRSSGKITFLADVVNARNSFTSQGGGSQSGIAV
ncbi:hypothetical protein BCR39DRAFT_502998 [Naematelia encephala]|uniref:Uncharacterized protein n=1 Tax=Naematelia encephala TaxID=71784 RepID=A0A1Y2BNR8_9TREE|nr:hypothetical protein BCR39DRAFT_502998 [Naematelia encephala]